MFVNIWWNNKKTLDNLINISKEGKNKVVWLKLKLKTNF